MEPDEISPLAQDEDGGRDRVDGDNVALVVDGQPSHNVDEPDGDGVTKKEGRTSHTHTHLNQKMGSYNEQVPEVSVRVEDLHARALASAVADDKVAVVAEDSHFAGVPQASLGFTLVPEHVLEDAVLVEHLKSLHLVNTKKYSRQIASRID